MRLSEAIRLGSLAIQNPLQGDVKYCAIGMGCAAVGVRRAYDSLAAEWPWTLEHATPGQGGTLYLNSGDKSTIALANMLSYTYMGAIAHLFDGQVCNQAITLESLCDQVRAWEDELAAKGINVEQVTMAAEPNQVASLTQSVPESAPFHVLEPDVAK